MCERAGFLALDSGVAPAGAVLATEAVRREATEGFRWTTFAVRDLKGVRRQPLVHVVARAVDGR